MQPNPTLDTPSWQQQLANAIRDPRVLLTQLKLPLSLLPQAEAAHALFPLRVPASYLARMEPGNITDPLLAQVLPLGAETATVPGFVRDPVGDAASEQTAGLLQKYQGRALLIATGACAIHCRYCFRRHYPYASSSAHRGQWDAIVERLKQDPDTEEVILSGGDPLTLSDTRLDELLSTLEALPQIQRIRIHTRLPVVLPDRVTPELCRRLAQSRCQLVIVIHANHANELRAGDVASALASLRASGMTLLNQAVLLKGVNDTTESQLDLCKTLFKKGVLPYYLHVLDPVEGAAHFHHPDPYALGLWRSLHRQLPGYLVPRLVREIPGEAGKTIIAG